MDMTMRLASVVTFTSALVERARQEAARIEKAIRPERGAMRELMASGGARSVPSGRWSGDGCEMGSALAGGVDSWGGEGCEIFEHSLLVGTRFSGYGQAP